MTADPDSILQERRVFVAVGIRDGVTKILLIVFRYFMCVSTKRRQLKPSFLRGKRKWIHFDGIEDVFATCGPRKEVVNPREQCVSAELKRIAISFQADSLRQ